VSHFQVLVVGSGFAGSLMAMITRRLGFSTALIERGRHPRFAIGESSTPLANLLLEQIAEKYALPGIAPLCKWGTWQKSTPQLACGLKRGFTFYHHEFGRPFEPDPDRRRQLLVGASPREEIADTHWYRPDFDHYLVQKAQSLGVEYWDETDLTEVKEEAKDMRLSGQRRGHSIEVTADFVIDASGPRGFLHQKLKLPETTFAAMPPTQALFSHFVDVAPLPASFSAEGLVPPYPVEDAAVHHIFDGGWVWVLKLNNGLTSAGVAATDCRANALDLSGGEPAWRRLMKQLPSLGESFCSARSTMKFIYQPRVAFQSGQITARNWVLLPSAAGVVDPLLSTGFPLTLFGLMRLGEIMEIHWERPSFAEALEDYAFHTRRELETTAELVGALYASMNRFDLFAKLTLPYFIAATFSETARRLGKFHLADTFLLSGHAAFLALLKNCCASARHNVSNGMSSDLDKCLESMKEFDVAGLTDRSRHPWYPALVEDLASNAWKLDVSEIDPVAVRQK
jgi:FADH2 O2-dependent halogenase